MDRRVFVKIFLASTGASLLSARSLRLIAADPTKVAKNAAIQNSKLWPAIRVCYQCIDLLNDVDDYEAVFVKRERFGRKLEECAMRMKIRHNPFSVYLLFGKPHEGREVIYVDGQNEGEMLVHETGLKSIVGTVSVDPEGDRAMEDNHHPITSIGMKKMVIKLVKQWEENAVLPDAEVKYYPKATIGEVPCKVVEVKNPRPVRGAAFHLTRLYIHDESNFPIRVQQYSFPKEKGEEPQLYEEYTYMNVKPDVGLQDIDFDAKNPKYNY
jgi:hypothetical protein